MTPLYDNFNDRRKLEEAKKADWEDLEELKQLEDKLNKKK